MLFRSEDVVINRSYGNEVLVAQCNIWTSDRRLGISQEIINRFAKIEDKITEHSSTFEELINEGRIAFWGGAGKSAMFIRKFMLPNNALVVDSHESKWGMFVPGTMIEIKPPDVLLKGHPKIVVATTSWRADDIAKQIERFNIPVEKLLKFENGQLVEVLRGN